MGYNTETYTKTFSIDLERANYHLKCKKSRKKRIFVVAIVWAIVFVYIFTPLSRNNLNVKGNVYYTKQDFLDMTYMNPNGYWWLFDTKTAKNVLESNEFIENVKYTKTLFGIKLEIEEIYPVGMRDNIYVMNNKTLIEKKEYDLSDRISSITNLDAIPLDDLNSFVNKYSGIELSVREHINKSELIKVELTEGEFYSYVKLYGYDDKIGYFIIKTDLVYLDTKFTGNKYDKIIGQVSKNNVKYSEDGPALIAYHYLDEEYFQLVEDFKEE